MCNSWWAAQSVAAASSRWLVYGSAAETAGQRVLLQFRFPLRILFVQLRVHEAGAGQRGLCEVIKVAQELDDFIATGG